MRWNAQTDANQPEIVEVLRRVGAKVKPLHRVGGGCPDILVGFRGVLYLMEIKTDKGKLNELEQKFYDTWDGYVWIVRTPEQALKLIGAIE